MKKTEKRIVLAANAIILSVAALVYALLLSPVSVTALASLPYGTAYRGADKTSVGVRIPLSWEAQNAERILSELEKSGVCVTFSFTPETVEEAPTLLYRVSHAGHGVELTLENSSYSGKLAEEALKNAADAAERITGERPAYFHSGPEGEPYTRAAAKLGMLPVSTTYDLGSQFASAASIEKRLASCAEPGAIITAQPTASFADALPFLIDLIKNMGLDIVPIHKMLYNKV